MLPSPLSSRWIHHFDQNQMPLSMHVLKYRIQVRSGYFIERMWHKMWCEWPGYNPDDPTQFQLGLLVMYFHQIKQQQKHLTIRKYNYACNDLTMNLTINTLSWQKVKLSNVIYYDIGDMENEHDGWHPRLQQQVQPQHQQEQEQKQQQQHQNGIAIMLSYKPRPWI